MDKVPITFDGLKKMEEELKNLIEIERPKIIIAVSEARDHGDLSENAEYSAAREKHAFIEGKINELEDKIARAEVIDISKIFGDRIKFGAKVHILDENSLEEKHLQIVGEYEADVDNGKISINSPLSKALIGRESGDLIEVNTPSGSKNYEIISFNYKVD